MTAHIQFKVNGFEQRIDVSYKDTPLLWILRDRLGLLGTKFGCGIGACGACTVHIDGQATLSCQIPVALLSNRTVTTIEGLSPYGLHPVQKAWIMEQVPQCGYCQSGQIMKAAELLATNPNPSHKQIIAHMRGNICRCGTYLRILRAIRRAADDISKTVFSGSE